MPMMWLWMLRDLSMPTGMIPTALRGPQLPLARTTSICVKMRNFAKESVCYAMMHWLPVFAFIQACHPSLRCRPPWLRLCAMAKPP